MFTLIISTILSIKTQYPSMVFHLRNLLHFYHYNHDSPNPSPQQSPVTQTSYQILHHFHIHIHTLHIAIIVTACFVSTVMLLLIFFMSLRRSYHSRRHNLNQNHNYVRRNTPILFDVHGYSHRDSTISDGDDDERVMVIDHPIWLIRTIGLQQSVIDSITVLKYRKNEGLFDGTECSVCLGEFQEEESLKLLPKCSHAFHVPCIETWLRSHKNCPLCRAPVVNEAVTDQLDSNISGDSSNQEGQIENFDNVFVEGLGSHNVEEFEIVIVDNDDSDSGVSSSERVNKNNIT